MPSGSTSSNEWHEHFSFVLYVISSSAIIDYHLLKVTHPTTNTYHKHTTMTFALLARRTTLLATRRATASSTSAMTKRRMGGSAAPAPEWEGIDKVVRGYLPQDDQREFIFILPIICVRRG